MKDPGLHEMLRQVCNEEIEYQPGYFVWQMEAEIRDAFIEAIERAAGEGESLTLFGIPVVIDSNTIGDGMLIEIPTPGES